MFLHVLDYIRDVVYCKWDAKNVGYRPGSIWIEFNRIIRSYWCFGLVDVSC
jgi:hypothetical protein